MLEMPPHNSNLGSMFKSLLLSSSSIIDVDFLMPNGFLLNLKCANDEALKDIKHKLFEEAKSYPLFDQLKSPNNYVFSSVSKESSVSEYYNENVRLSDIHLFHPFFKLVELQGDLEDRKLNSDIVLASGIRKENLDKIEDNLEIIDFRNKMFTLVRDELKNKNDLSTRASIEHQFPQNLNAEFNFLVPHTVNSRKIEVIIRVKENDKLFEQVYRVRIQVDFKPNDLISEVIRVKLKEQKQSEFQIAEMINRYKDAYLLNICGSNELVYGNENCLASYKYISNCLSNDETPEFRLVSINLVRSKMKFDTDLLNSLLEQDMKNKPRFEGRYELSWNISNNFLVHIERADYLPIIDDCDHIFCKLAIYNGNRLISNVKFTEARQHNDSMWNQTIELDFQISNLHRCSKLCFGLYYVSKKRQITHLIGWISLNIFDYMSVMLNGTKNLHLWPTTINTSYEKLAMSVAASGQNPKKDYVCVTVSFPAYIPNAKIRYPSIEEMKIGFFRRIDTELNDECLGIEDQDEYRLMYTLKAKKSIWVELTEQEKRALWNGRNQICAKYSNSLPKLIQSKKWTLKEHQIELYRLLHKPWPIVDIEVALELLNSFYFDCEVRQFAVRCLDLQMQDSLVHEYLLQLIQALKNETYFDNELARFLLKRALRSLKIGFDFYWILKTEMNDVKFKYRFGILLEAYCRGIGSNFKLLMKQINAINKLTCLSDQIKEFSKDTSIFTSTFLADTLNLPDYQQALCDLLNPLNTYETLGKIDATKCKIFTSARRPLALAWNSLEQFSSIQTSTRVIDVIFKQGDDIRQDTLTLQILKLMDNIWKREGLNMRMIIYKATSTGFKIGFIEKIKAKTLCKIQIECGKASTYQMDSLSLYKWICDNNAGIERQEKAIENFTKSCAAYCVATYVLGIADRHTDNIMINENGQLFHIDFGHILGHFKMKFGIKRERVPFVLTGDFAKVISKGSSTPIETKEFNEFKKLCVRAYMIIRRHSNLIFNLFSLMITSDMPELQSMEDILYLNETLALDLNDEAAKQFFIGKFEESYNNRHKPKIDWVFHAINSKNLIQ